MFCYADYLLIASTTSTGLQALIDLCDPYISQHGLRFNPQKTSCTTVGKHRLVSQAQWTIKSRQLKVTDTFSYLGAVLGNGGSAEHVNQRIRPAKNAHRSLQVAGLHANGLDPLAAMHVYSLGVQPCLNYGAHAIDLSTTELRTLDTTHSNLIKWSLGLSKFCRSTPPPFYELLASKEYQLWETTSRSICSNGAWPARLHPAHFTGRWYITWTLMLHGS